MIITATVYARHRPGWSTARHAVIDGDERALCGVWAGEPAEGDGPTCLACREALAPPVASAEAAVIAEAEAALAGPPLVLISACSAGHAHVWFGYSALLVAIIRQIPAATFDREEKCWLIPTQYVAEAERRLRNAGADVSTTV